eukprot:359163-Rhodomonas_salina.1
MSVFSKTRLLLQGSTRENEEEIQVTWACSRRAVDDSNSESPPQTAKRQTPGLLRAVSLGMYTATPSPRLPTVLNHWHDPGRAGS